ncbi:MAG TPA: protein-disulfide reductase DsbD domain-containing protein [Polyangiaceae bacterium]|nr:protein-disulfide reductase DsbD domain-containing protein [Polyangiaceae bacterium]
MAPSFRARAASALLVALAPGCGGSGKPPSDPNAQAERDREKQQRARAEREKSSRLARLDSSDLADRPLESVVQVTFEPLVTGVRPGRKFLLAAHFRIAPGYRVSWTNPGDVGKETVVTVSAPPGFEVSPARFPVPERYTVPGGYVGFGYQNETAVFVEVKAPATLSGGGVHRFDLSASWVACKKECATEHTEAFIELATTRGSAAAKDVEAKLSAFQERLPRPLADVKDADRKWEPSGHRSTLLVNLPGAEVRDFWPGAHVDPAPQVVASGERLRVVFEGKPEEKDVRGLVIASENGKEAFYELEANSAEDAESKSTPRPERTPGKKAKPKARGKRR